MCLHWNGSSGGGGGKENPLCCVKTAQLKTTNTNNQFVTFCYSTGYFFINEEKAPHSCYVWINQRWHVIRFIPCWLTRRGGTCKWRGRNFSLLKSSRCWERKERGGAIYIRHLMYIWQMPFSHNTICKLKSAYLFYQWGSGPAPPSISGSSPLHFLCVFGHCSGSSSPMADESKQRRRI